MDGFRFTLDDIENKLRWCSNSGEWSITVSPTAAEVLLKVIADYKELSAPYSHEQESPQLRAF